LTGGQRHEGLLGVVAATDTATKALGLALLVQDLHGLHFDLEQQLNSGLDLGLGGIAQHLEQHLATLFSSGSGLFRDDRSDQHLQQAGFIKFQSAHANISCSLAIAPLVTTTFL